MPAYTVNFVDISILLAIISLKFEAFLNNFDFCRQSRIFSIIQKGQEVFIQKFLVCKALQRR